MYCTLKEWHAKGFWPYWKGQIVLGDGLFLAVLYGVFVRKQWIGSIPCKRSLILTVWAVHNTAVHRFYRRFVFMNLCVCDIVYQRTLCTYSPPCSIYWITISSADDWQNQHMCAELGFLTDLSKMINHHWNSLCVTSWSHRLSVSDL